MRRTTTAVSLVVLGLVATATARADDAGYTRCSAGTSERLRFIEDRLEERRPYANYWWIGWTGFYGIGTVVQSVRAGVEDDDSKQADLVVSAAKAVIGTTRLFFWPPTARSGADAMRVVAASDESQCRERLRVGEELLRKNARESKRRWNWVPHTINIGLNVAGGIIVHEGWDDPSRAWRSAGIGIAVGEAMIFSHPWKADGDLADYESRFGTNPDLSPKPISWNVGPQLGGLALHVTF
jgi:hypothetical protein